MTGIQSKIIFLGSNISPISLSCLKAIAANDRYELLVGIDQNNNSAWSKARTTLQRHGLKGWIQRVLTLINVKFRMSLQSVGTDFRAGRSLREVAALKGMATFQCTAVNGSDVRDTIKKFEPDLIVVANFSQIIRAKVRGIPKFGAINFHPSLLPKHRGPSPCYWVIKNGERKTGGTVHFIDEGIDTGDIILQRDLAVLPNESEKRLTSRIMEIGAPLLCRAIESVLAGTAQRLVQNESEATYYGFPNSGKIKNAC